MNESSPLQESRPSDPDPGTAPEPDPGADPDTAIRPGDTDREGADGDAVDGIAGKAGGADSGGAGSGPPGARTGRGRRRRVLLAALAVLAIGLAGLLLFEGLTWPDVGRLKTENPRTTAFIERWKERSATGGREPSPEWHPVPSSEISPWLKKAVLVSEDIEFFQHHGFSTSEIRAALEKAWEEKEAPRGASTLTQQLAKNLWLSPSRNPMRKLKEALLTMQLERELGKRRILELYLNVVEFGPGIYGAEAAARHYFGVPASALGPGQAAELAAGLPAPARWHPGSGSAVYARRVERILARMEKATFLDRSVGLPPGGALDAPAPVPDTLVPVPLRPDEEIEAAPIKVPPAHTDTDSLSRRPPRTPA